MSELLIEQAREIPEHHARPSSPSHDYYQYFFEGADLLSAMWQPLLKSVGRWHLEVAGLGMKHGQATLQLTRDLSRSMSPGDMVSAQIRYWDSVSAQYTQSSQRLAATVQRSVETPFAPEVFALPSKRADAKRDHDMIVLPDESAAESAQSVRKVA